MLADLERANPKIKGNLFAALQRGTELLDGRLSRLLRHSEDDLWCLSLRWAIAIAEAVRTG